MSTYCVPHYVCESAAKAGGIGLAVAAGWGAIIRTIVKDKSSYFGFEDAVPGG